MAESTTGTLANMETATATATDRGVVVTLMEANSRLAKQLEDRSNELKYIKAFLKKERSERKGHINLNSSPDTYCWTHGYKAANSHTSISWNYPKHGHKREATKTDNIAGYQANREWCAGATSLNNREKFEECRTPPLIEHHETAIVDYGCTGHFLLVNAPCQRNVKSKIPLRVRLPNGDTMDSTHTSSLYIPELSKAASIANVFPGVANNSLLSVVQICNEGYYVTFRIDGVKILQLRPKVSFENKKEIWIPDSGASTWGMKNNSTPCLWTITFMNYVAQESYSTTCTKLYSAQQNMLFCRLSRIAISWLGQVWLNKQLTNIWKWRQQLPCDTWINASKTYVSLPKYQLLLT
jgi:hypothetical protein